MIEIECPYPPSGNNRNEMSFKSKRWGRGAYVTVQNSEATQRFYSHMRALFLKGGYKTIEENCAVDVLIYPPDRRARDIDNVLKTLFDGLERGGFLKNDNQIKKMRAEMMPHIDKQGKIQIKIYSAIDKSQR